MNWFRLLLGLTIVLAAAPAIGAPTYRLAGTTALGAPDRWDYLHFDPGSSRLYVAHGDRLTVVDGGSGAIVGEVAGIAGGAHGTVISGAAGQGFTDDGRNGQVIAFDPATLKVTKRIAAGEDADGIALDRATGLVFIVEGDSGTVMVLDPRSDIVVATVHVGEKLEFPVADDMGHVFIAGDEKGDVVKLDARSKTVVARWPAPGCTSPHGLAIDAKRGRLFMGCANAVMAELDTTSGRVVRLIPIGRGNDAVAYDPVRRRVFSSNSADGTISVYQEAAGDRLDALPIVETAIGGRTMTLDPHTGRLFVAAAATDPDPAGGRPKVRPGTLKLLMYDPIETTK